MTDGLWYLDNHVIGIRALLMVWGRITTTKGWELGEVCGRSTQVHTVFASRPNVVLLSRRPRQAPRIPEKTYFCTSGFSLFDRNYAWLSVFSQREERNFFTCQGETWAGVSFLQACNFKGLYICAGQMSLPLEAQRAAG